MTTLCKWGGILLLLLLATPKLSAQKVKITSSQEVSGVLKMDAFWEEAASTIGFNAQIVSNSFLNDPISATTTQILVLSASIDHYSANQTANILDFVRSGGNLYIQSEYISSLGGNILFQHVVSETNGYFQWGEQKENNLGPVTIDQEFVTDGYPNELAYFWYGVEGCGDDNIVPFLFKGTSQFGFFYQSSDSSHGTVATNCDQDWVRKISDDTPNRKALLSSILKKLDEGIDDFLPETPVLSIDAANIDCSDEWITANVTHGSEEEIQWYVNDVWIAQGAQLSLSNLKHNDSYFASFSFNSGCTEKTIVTPSFTFTKIENYHPAFETSISGQGIICQGQAINLVAEYDEKLSGVSHQWFINGINQDINRPAFSSLEIRNGDVITHALSYSDGCNEKTIQTDQAIRVEIIVPETSSIYISSSGEVSCDQATQMLHLKGTTPILDPEIQWYINDIAINHDAVDLEIPLTNDPQTAYAIVAYHDNCGNPHSLTTETTEIRGNELNLEILELVHNTCNNSGGWIEVYSDGINVSYSWDNGQTGPFIADLEAGNYTVIATGTEGCSKMLTISIEDETDPIIKDLMISQPDCSKANGNVELSLGQSINEEATIRWWNEDDELIASHALRVDLDPGSYLVEVQIGDYCSESRTFTIQAFKEAVLSQDTLLINQGQTVQLDLQHSLLSQINWIDHEGLSCQDCLNPTLTSSYSGILRYELITELGCFLSGSIYIEVVERSPFYAPSAFSPNNDGYNDFYKISPRQGVIASSGLKVFDRWGSLIFQDSANDGQGWDGKVFGRDAQKGVYVYFQQFTDENGKIHTAQGSVSLL